jgi:hypothetical protein
LLQKNKRLPRYSPENCSLLKFPDSNEWEIFELGRFSWGTPTARRFCFMALFYNIGDQDNVPVIQRLEL